MRDFHVASHEYFRSLILDPRFACIAGQSAVRGQYTGRYVFGAYPELTDDRTAEAVCHDLVKYAHEFAVADMPGESGVRFVSFVAAFADTGIGNQLEGVRRFYTLLYKMHMIDRQYYSWAEGFSNKTDDPDFGYSIGGNAYFVPFLYTYSGSRSRVSDVPMVIFNSHHTFAKLREVGAYEALKKQIHARQPWGVHPFLGDHGSIPEFRQYSLVDNTEEAIEAEKVIREEIIGERGFR